MEITFQHTTMLLVTVLTGLTAGLCFTWSNAVTPGIGQLDDLTFLKAFQGMNRSILNPLFFIVFLGPTIVHAINVYTHRNAEVTTLWIYAMAAALFIIGVVLVTIFKNVPLNEVLDKTDLLTASKEELVELRALFENPWNRWHRVRTISSFVSFSLLVIQLILQQKIV